MNFEWLNLFRRNRREAHRAIFDFEQAAVAEEHSAEVLRDLAAVGKQKLDVLASVVKASREFDDGDELMAEAARAYREGIAALVATPPSLYPTDGEARRDAMQVPSRGSTGSPPSSAGGLASWPSPMALDAPGQPEAGQGGEPPKKRPRGRPAGTRNKLKPRSDDPESSSA